MKKSLNKKQYKLLFFISMFLLSISSALIPISASGIEYEKEATYYHFDINENYPYFISSLYDLGYTTFNYSVVFPIQFYIDDYMFYDLRIDIVNGALANLSAEYIGHAGMPTTQYFTDAGFWNDDVTTVVLLEYGLRIKETQLDLLFDFNFEYDDNRSFENVEDRWLKYQIINQLFRIKLSSFRLFTNIQDSYNDNITKFYNISPIYVDDSSHSNYILSGITLGYNVKNSSGERIPLDIPKFSFDSNNEKYNEYTVFIEKAKYVTARDEFYVRYNNLEIVGSIEEGYSENTWLNNNYKYIIIYSDFGLYDMLNLSILGEFNVSQYSIGFDAGGTFGDLFTGIANVPIVVLSNLLSFELFGWTAFVVLCSIVTLLVIIWLIKKLVGGR